MLDHMQAMFLTFIFENGGKPTFNPNEFALFVNKPQACTLYAALQAALGEAHAAVRFVPKKTYISLDGDKVLGCATPTKEGLKVGLDLGEIPLEGRVQKAKGLGAMPNVTHMVEVKDAGEIDADLLKLVGMAFERTRKVKKAR